MSRSGRLLWRDESAPSTRRSTPRGFKTTRGAGLQDEGFMRGIACGKLLSRRSDLGLISVPRLHGAMLLIVERNGVMNAQGAGRESSALPG